MKLENTLALIEPYKVQIERILTYKVNSDIGYYFTKVKVLNTYYLSIEELFYLLFYRRDHYATSNIIVSINDKRYTISGAYNSIFNTLEDISKYIDFTPSSSPLIKETYEIT